MVQHVLISVAGACVRTAGWDLTALNQPVHPTSLVQAAHRYAHVTRQTLTDATHGMESVFVRQVGRGRPAPVHVHFISMVKHALKHVHVKTELSAIPSMELAIVLQDTQGLNVRTAA